MLVLRTSLSKSKNTEIIPSAFSDHSGMEREINKRRKIKILANMWKLCSALLNSQYVKEEINMEIKVS